METQKTKKYSIMQILVAVLFFSAFFLNASLFVANDDVKNSKASLFLQASADGGESGGSLRWSPQISCNGGEGGSYQICVLFSGMSAPCNFEGDVTCTCGTNC